VTAGAILYILPRIDRVGRIPLQKGGFALMAVGLAIFALGVAMPSVAVLFFGSTLYALGLGLGPAVTIFALAVEIFPTEWRASVAGLATSVSRLGAVFSAVLFPILEQRVGVAALLMAVAAVAWLGRIITARFAVESSARSLEALEREALEAAKPGP
ncbi:MAG: MFS transporter, partial [Acidithiobacillus sp.]